MGERPAGRLEFGRERDDRGHDDGALLRAARQFRESLDVFLSHEIVDGVDVPAGDGFPRRHALQGLPAAVMATAGGVQERA